MDAVPHGFHAGRLRLAPPIIAGLELCEGFEARPLGIPAMATVQNLGVEELAASQHDGRLTAGKTPQRRLHPGKITSEHGPPVRHFCSV